MTTRAEIRARVKQLLELVQLGHQLVVFVISDELIAFDVIRVVVPMDFASELGVAGFGLIGRHV